MTMMRNLALVGNVVFILWIAYNGIDEGVRSVGRVEAAALFSLVLLLSLNIFVLVRKR